MNKNIGRLDQIIRIIAGLSLISWAIYSGNQIGFLGAIPLATGIIRWCPAYCPLRISTCNRKPQ